MSESRKAFLSGFFTGLNPFNSLEVLRSLWCDWTHGGGWIMRDPSGRVNWQCKKCGRWADPVSEEDERRITDAALSSQAGKEKGEA